MAYINVCGKQIYYEEYGDTKHDTLIYVHGGPGESCLTYTYQAQTLGAYFHVISFDQYGVFRSDAMTEEENANVKFQVDMIEQMRIALGIRSWTLLGHSFGGMLALIYAHTYADSTDAVIYDCPMWSALHTARAMAQATLPYYQEHNMAEQAEFVKEILDEKIKAKDAFQKALGIDLNNEEMRNYCHVIEISRYNSYLNEHIAEPDVTADCWGKYMRFQAKLFDSEDFYYDYLPYLSEIWVPQLLIVGEYDMTCGKFEQKWFSEQAINGKVEILSNSAHLSWFEQPEKYTDLIVKFMERNGKISGCEADI